MKVSDFTVWNAAHQVEIIDSGTGKSKLVPFTGVWLKSPQARRFVHARAVQQHACHRSRQLLEATFRCSKIIFDPSWAAAGGAQPPDVYNVFRGFEIMPNPGASCELMLDHHNFVLCGNDPERIKYSLSWWASVVQRPEQKIGVSVCYRGGNRG